MIRLDWLVTCSVVLLILPGTATAALTPAMSASINAGEFVEGCTTITESGTFVLESNITADHRDYCIIIENTRNVVLDAQGHAIDGQLKAAIFVVGSRNITVRNLVSSASSNYGIWVDKSQHIILENITIRQLQNQTVAADAARRALFLTNSKNLFVRSNRIEGIGLRNESGPDNGLSFRHSESITITDNAIFGTSSAVSLVNSSEIRVSENFLARNVYGIQMRRFSHDIIVRKNVIQNHTLCPMDVKNSSDILIENNRMIRHAGLALAINATNVTISSNVLANSTSFGIVVATDSSQVNILNNTVTNSSSFAGIGIFGRVSDVRVDENTIANNSPHGIFLEQDVFRVSIRNNSIFGNARNGVAIHPRVDSILIADNRIFNNGERAIANEVSEGVQIKNNTVHEERGEQITSEKTSAESNVERGVTTKIDSAGNGDQSPTTDSPGQVGFDLLLTIGALILFIIFSLHSRES